MPAWKILFIMLLGGICLGLALSTFIVPFSMMVGGERWLWFGGLFVGTAVMSTLFALFLAHEDRKYSVGGGRRR